MLRSLIKSLTAPRLKTYTYQVDGEEAANVTIKAYSPLDAAMKSGEFAKSHRMLLVGPLELARQPIYQR